MKRLKDTAPDMRKRIEEIGLLIVMIASFSYVANFIWESLHAVSLYQNHDFPAQKYIRIIAYVSAVDTLIILVIYLLVAVIWRDMLWLKTVNRTQRMTVFVVYMTVAAIIEYRKVYVSKAWAYNMLMPTIFGIGISPLLQLSMTGLLSLWLARRLLYEKGFFYRGP